MSGAAEALASLQARIGHEVHVSDWMTVTQDRVVAFADATGDQQWIHVDLDRARLESPFGGPIAHGYLTLSLQIVLRGLTGAEQAVTPGVRQVVNYGLDRLRFPAPVPVGARIRGRFTLLEAMQVAPDVLQVKERYSVEVEGNDKPACIAESLYRLYF